MITETTEILNSGTLQTIEENPKMGVSQIKPAQFPALVKSPRVINKKQNFLKPLTNIITHSGAYATQA